MARSGHDETETLQVLALVAMLGYLYTAGIITGLLIDTIWLALAVIVINMVVLRWLALARRKLAWQIALKEREEKRAEAEREHDTETEGEIRGALKHLMEGRSTFIIAHRIQSVMNADLILVLDKGRIVQQGSHETLIRQEGMYQRIYELQARIEQEVEEEVTYA